MFCCVSGESRSVSSVGDGPVLLFGWLECGGETGALFSRLVRLRGITKKVSRANSL